MALLNQAGFEYGNITTSLEGSGSDRSSSATAARSGDYGLRINLTSGVANYIALRNYDTTGAVGNFSGKTTLAIRANVKFASNPNADTALMCIRNSGGDCATVRWRSSDKTLEVLDSTGTARGGTSTTTIDAAASRWVCLELKSYLHATAGTVELRVNGVTEVSATSIDTQAGTGITFTTTYFGVIAAGPSSGDLYFDDLAVADDWPTNAAIKRLDVTGDGYYTAWTNTYTSVDEIPPSTSDYIYTTTNPAVETVALEDCSSAGVSGTISGIKSCLTAIRGGSSNGSIQLRRRSNGTDYDLSSYATTSSSVTISKVDAVDPNTSSAWTTSGLDALELGAENLSTKESRVSFIGCEVAQYEPYARLGTITQTTDYCDQAAEGAVSSGFSGTIAQSAAAATQTAEGCTLWGTAVQNTAPCTQTASGTQLASGTITQNAAAATQAAQGTCFWATVSQTAAACVQTATGAEIYSSTAAQLTAACTQAATGAEIYSGTSAQIAAACVQTAAGAEIYTGTIEQNAAAAYQAAEGTAQLNISGDAAQTTAPAVQSAAAELIFSATITQNADAADQALEGAIVANIGAITQSAQPSAQELSGALIFSAAITQQTAAAVQQAAGTQLVTATAAQQTAAATQELSGMVANHIGTAAQTIAPATQAATAALIFSATATQTTAACFQSADGAEIYSATATQTATACTQAATAQVAAHIGQITQTAQPAQQAAAATLTFEGSIAQTTAAATQLLAGEMPLSASVAQTTAPAQQAATGEVLLLEGAITQVTTACIQSADALTYFSYVTGTSAQQSAAAQQLAAGALVAIGELIQQLSACTQTLSAVNDAAIRNISMSGSFITADTASATFLDASLSGSMINTTTFTGTV